MKGLLARLACGDRRSTGAADAIARDVLTGCAAFAELWEGLYHPDSVIRMRAADAAEKVSRECPEWLRPYKNVLLGELARIDQAEVAWHVDAMIARLELTDEEAAVAARHLRERYTAAESRIVKVAALQGLVDLAAKHRPLQPDAVALMDSALYSGVPSLAARARQLAGRNCRCKSGEKGRA